MEYINLLWIDFCIIERINKVGRILFDIIFFLMSVLLKCWEMIRSLVKEVFGVWILKVWICLRMEVIYEDESVLGRRIR